MPHRRGSFREDWNQLLERFAHRRTPAANTDELPEAKQKKHRPPRDIHQLLFKSSRPGEASPSDKTN